MILVDSSVWIEFLRGSATGRSLATLIDHGAPVACTEPVMMELLAGTRSADEYSRLRSLILAQAWLPFDALADFEGAARVFVTARAHGITPTGQVDCMIVAVAARTESTFMTFDAQQRAIATLLGIEVLS